MDIYDKENGHANICAMQSADGKNVYVSFSKGALAANTFISKEAARELAEGILEILEEMPDTDNDAQTSLRFNEYQEAA